MDETLLADDILDTHHGRRIVFGTIDSVDLAHSTQPLALSPLLISSPVGSTAHMQHPDLRPTPAADRLTESPLPRTWASHRTHCLNSSGAMFVRGYHQPRAAASNLVLAARSIAVATRFAGPDVPDSASGA